MRWVRGTLVVAAIVVLFAAIGCGDGYDDGGSSDSTGASTGDPYPTTETSPPGPEDTAAEDFFNEAADPQATQSPPTTDLGLDPAFVEKLKETVRTNGGIASELSGLS